MDLRIFFAAVLAVGSVGEISAQENISNGSTTSSGQVVSKADERAAEILKRYPPPGRFVQVEGRRLHILCKGPERGPTFVIEGGSFASSYMYWKAQDEISKDAGVCTYDRAGLGWSESAALPRSIENRVDDLHGLLRGSGRAGPYVLVGHSMGGLLVRLYAHKYPSDVAGLILVEPSNERVNATEDAMKRSAQSAAQVGMAFPVLAAGGSIPQLRIPNGPPEQEIIQRESAFRAGQDDLAAMSKLASELQAFGPLGSLGNKPLIVITRGKRDPGMTEEREKEWSDSHKWLTTLSTRSELIVAEKSGHVVNVDQPELFRDAAQRILGMR
jgi:pimeloyl-ACP methyl ester carboxylesterase